MTEQSRTFDSAHWQRLESPERLARLDPPGMVGRLGLPHGAHVADLGSGTGVFTVELAKAVGETGRVFALDSSEEMVRIAGTRNLPPWVRVMHVDLSHELPLPEGSLDCCLIAFVLHEVTPHEAFVRQMFHVLKHGGTVAVLEWRDDATGPGGPEAAHRIGTKTLESLLTAQGFENPHVAWQSDREYLMLSTRPDPAHNF